MAAARGNARAPAVVSEDDMPDRRRFAIVVTPLLALLGVAAAILWPANAAPAAAQSAEPAVVCFEITVGWRICAAPAVAPAQPPGPCATGAAVPDAANNPGLVADCTALVTAKDALRGTAALNWSADRAITAWDGVTVRGTPPRVTELRLGYRWLTGTIPAAFGELSQLRRLHLQHNRLSGPIPPALGDLAQMEELLLYRNLLTGAVPPELGALARLERLYLSGNRLTGAIPPELGDLARLLYLSLGGNLLMGAIPPELGALARLQWLSLRGNLLWGAIPPDLGDLARLNILSLSGNRLTGAIPPGLADLPLSELSLSENDLTGCLPRELTQVERNDVAYLGLASCPLRSETLTYGAPVTTGSVTDDGGYAFLTDPDDLTTLVTTYEGLRAGLRDGTTIGLVLHKNDGDGTSQEDFYDMVEAGDLVEWREAADCWVRYQIDEIHPDPAGDPPRKLLAVAWMTYAFTGCSGAISSTATASLQFGPLPALGGTSLTAPVVHGMTQIVPEDWAGAIMEPDLRNDPSGPPPYVYTTDLATARTLPYWREPRLPDDWTFREAEGGYGSLTAPIFGYCADYRNVDAYVAVEICGFYVRDALVRPVEATWSEGRGAAATRVVNGRPVVVVYSPPGPNQARHGGISALIYDRPTRTAYWINGSDRSLRQSSDIDAVLAILGSLFESPNPP